MGIFLIAWRKVDLEECKLRFWENDSSRERHILLVIAALIKFRRGSESTLRDN